VFILKAVKVLCFDTLLQVFILREIVAKVFHHVMVLHVITDFSLRKAELPSFSYIHATASVIKREPKRTAEAT